MITMLAMLTKMSPKDYQTNYHRLFRLFVLVIRLFRLFVLVIRLSVARTSAVNVICNNTRMDKQILLLT